MKNVLRILSVVVIGFMTLSTSWAASDEDAKKECNHILSGFGGVIFRPVKLAKHQHDLKELDRILKEINSSIETAKSSNSKISRTLEHLEDEIDYRKNPPGMVSRFFTGMMGTFARPYMLWSNQELEAKVKQLNSELRLDNPAIESLENERTELKARRDQMENDLKKVKWDDFAEFIKFHPEYELILNDFLGAITLSRLTAVNFIVVSVTQDQIESVWQDITEITDQGFNVLLDTDARGLVLPGTAPFALTVITPELNPELKVRQIAIDSDYLRWQTLAHFPHRIELGGSPLTIAEMLHTGGSTGIMMERANMSLLGDWQKALEDSRRNLGVSGYRKDNKKPNLVDHNSPHNVRLNIPPVDIRRLSFMDLDEAQRSGVIDLVNELSGYGPAARSSLAVVFGGGRTDYTSANDLYEIAYELSRMGYGLSTGGAGGAMQVASEGAFDGGGISIGVPIGGHNQLDTEKVVHSGVHTQTLMASDYKSRIPLLKAGKQLYIVAPGGGGTLREVASTLYRLASRPNEFGAMIFLNRGYYSGLMRWFDAAGLPEKLRQRLVLVENWEELQVSLKVLQNKGLIQLPEAQDLKPRGDKSESMRKRNEPPPPDDYEYMNYGSWD